MNTFGPSTSQRYALCNPQSARLARERFGRDEVPDLARANSLCVPTGRWPSRGWVLLARGDYDLIDPYSTTLQLDLGDPRLTDNVGTLKNLAVVQAQCVTRGIAADPTALYLVELTDARGILCNKWFQFPIEAKYNIRSPAYPQTFHPASMDTAGVTTTWTWARMLEDMWGRMPLLGAWPGLPAGVTLAGTPEGFWFLGVPAWYAMCDVLDHLGLTVACDLTAAAPFTIVRPGATDAAFDLLHVKYATTASPHYRLEDDLEWLDVGAGRVPKTVQVMFRRRNSVYGTEETVTYRDDDMARQWSMDSVYTVSVTAPATFTSAVGTHYLWSDFTVRYDESGNPLDADVAMAATIAQERVTQYFARVYRQTLGRMSRTFAGALPFKTGSQVDGVRWAMDHRRGDGGGTTEIVRGILPPWPELW
jgi:hypothetical protein